jgi:hypothetical protein
MYLNLFDLQNINTEQNNIEQYKIEQHRTKFKVLNKCYLVRCLVKKNVILIF